MKAEKRWSRADAKEAGRLLVDTIDKLAKDQEPRRLSASKRLGIYLARTQDSRPALCADTYSQTSEPGQQYPLRIAQSVIDTAKAKIAARQRPKGQVLTKGGNYKHRLQAKQLSKFCEGILYQQQGTYETSWELGDQVFKDCTIWEAGLIMVVPDTETERISHERFFAHNMYFDPLEAKSGTARHCHVRFPASKYALAERFPKHEDAILKAELCSADADGATGKERSADMCSLYAGWFVGRGKSKGRVIYAVKSAKSLVVLIDTEWTWPCFPFASVIWERDQFGPWGTPAVDQIGEPQVIANDVFVRMEQSVRTHARGYLDVEKDTYDDSSMEMATGEFKVLEREPGKPPANVKMPEPFNPATFQFFQTCLSQCYELPGISEMSAQGRKEPGIVSGRAILSVNDMQDQRFLPKSRAYENLYVQLARLDMYAARDLRKDGIKVRSSHGQGEYLDEIIWDDVEPEDDEQFTIQASSSAEDTLAGRRQFIADAQASGELSPDAAKLALASPNPDVESMTRRELAQQRYLERVISRFQYAEADTWDPAVDSVAPDELLTKPTAYAQMVDGYLEMLGDEFPEFNLRLMRDFITLLGKAMSAAAPPPAPAAPMGPPGGGGMPMPGAEAAPPMMAPPGMAA